MALSLTGPRRPQRRPKRPSVMSFRSLPPIPRPLPPKPAEELVKQYPVCLANSSSIELTADAATADLVVQHRKWVKLRVMHESGCDKISASRVLFRFYCSDNRLENNGCEVQEVSAWIEDYEFLEGDQYHQLLIS